MNPPKIKTKRAAKKIQKGVFALIMIAFVCLSIGNEMIEICKESLKR